MTYGNILRWGICLLILAFGVLSHDAKGISRWFVLTIVIYAIPLIAQFMPRTWVRVYGIYFGLFVLIQAVISPHFFPDTFKTLPPNMNVINDIRGNNLPGISGPQHIQTDARGFRTTKPVNYDAKADFRIFFVGASTVEQAWIGNRKTFPHLIQEKLSASLGRNVEVINTGVSGLRAVHHLETMRRTAKFHPDLYVIVPGANDWGLHITVEYDKDSPDRFEHSPVHLEASLFRIKFLDNLRRYSIKTSLLGRAILAVTYVVKGQLSGRVASSNEPVRSVTDAPFYQEVRGSLFRKDKRTFSPKSVRPGYAKKMGEIVAFCKKSPVRCVFVTHPHSFKPGTTEAYRRTFWMTPPFEKYTLTFESMAHIASTYNRYLIELGKKSGVPVCDLESQIAPTIKNFRDEIHFNIEGSRKAANVLFPCLLEVVRAKGPPYATPSN